MARYDVKESEFASHSVIARVVGDGGGKSLLDVGCAHGQLSATFVSQGWDVTGIEPDSVDAAVARGRGIRVIEMTVEDSLELLEEKFDMIVLADVLEHCANPWIQLSRLVTLCRPDSKIVISLPNIAHISVRMMLVLGHFDYSARGILDRTHLRFFTRRTALDLVSSAGVVVECLKITPTPVELIFPRLMKSAWSRRFLAFNAGVSRVMPRLLGYQFILVCRVPDPSSVNSFQEE